MKVCERCLCAIESHEGEQIKKTIYLDEEEDSYCEWCEEDGFDKLYEI